MQNDTYPMEKKPLNNPDIKLSVPSVAGKPPFLYHSTEVKKKEVKKLFLSYQFTTIYYHYFTIFMFSKFDLFMNLDTGVGT